MTPAPSPERYRVALRHLLHGGELRVYIGAGERCRCPPKIGSGVIDSDMGRVFVSKLTIRRIAPFLTWGNVRTLNDVWRRAADLAADGFTVEMP